MSGDREEYKSKKPTRTTRERVATNDAIDERPTLKGTELSKSLLVEDVGDMSNEARRRVNESGKPSSRQDGNERENGAPSP
jgi:hypothetical protein